ncbi:MAG TPA: threonine-phosphate decarboxylase [Firmicutes bacterium]|nr:threonine-phosphate decarboxylase [Candidatus Fermentithermobacillaceae bacterium]
MTYTHGSNVEAGRITKAARDDSMMYVHGGNVALASRLYGLGQEAFLDFSANVNPFGPSEAALDAITANFGRICRYPEPTCSELRDTLGRYLNIGPHRIIAGNGANELIHLVVRAMKPGRVLIVAPTFSEYGRAVEIEGGTVQWFPVRREQGFLPDMQELAAQLPEVDMLFICNPNNPSGALFYRDEFLAVADRAGEHGVVVVVDEAFVDFTERPNQVTLRYEAVLRENLLVIGSLTKFFALPGLRLGYAIGSGSLIKRLWDVRDPWSVNCLAQAAAIASIEDDAYIRKTREWISVERPFLFRSLFRIRGIEAYSPSANYVLLDLRGTGFTAERLQKALGPKGILIRDCSNYPFLDEYYARVAVRTREDNTALLATLEDILVG